jgi:ParB-like nuclease family protein
VKTATAGTVATRLILNANPAGSWVRTAVHVDPKMTQGIKEDGIKVPLLVMPDFRVVDGARRLMAAQRLHLPDVPVTIARVWEDAYEYFLEVRRLEREEGLATESLKLRELDRLIVLLLELYGTVRRENIGKAAKARWGKRPVSAESRSNTSTTVNRALGEMLGMTSSDIAVRRNIFSAARKAERESPELGRKIWDLVTEAEEEGARMYSLEGIVRDMAAGRPVDGRRRLYPKPARGQNERMLRHARKLVDPQALAPDPKLAAEQVKRLTNMLTLLRMIGDEAAAFEQLNTAFNKEQAEQFLTSYRAVTAKISRIRRVLWDLVNDNQGESS